MARLCGKEVMISLCPGSSVEKPLVRVDKNVHRSILVILVVSAGLIAGCVRWPLLGRDKVGVGCAGARGRLGGVVGKGGLEPPRLAAHDPKSCSSANSDTPPEVMFPGAVNPIL